MRCDAMRALGSALPMKGCKAKERSAFCFT